MKHLIIHSTVSAIKAITALRLFRSERGYQGALYCKLNEELEKHRLVNEDKDNILEMEYQKSTRHGMSQRPDIIFHIPTEHSGGIVNENNYAVWALKKGANVESAQEDFKKLDQMFGTLNYPLGFFINIDTENNHLNSYAGKFKDRIVGFSILLRDELPQVKKSWFDGNEFREQHV